MVVRSTPSWRERATTFIFLDGNVPIRNHDDGLLQSREMASYL